MVSNLLRKIEYFNLISRLHFDGVRFQFLRMKVHRKCLVFNPVASKISFYDVAVYI